MILYSRSRHTLRLALPPGEVSAQLDKAPNIWGLTVDS